MRPSLPPRTSTSNSRRFRERGQSLRLKFAKPLSFKIWWFRNATRIHSLLGSRSTVKEKEGKNPSLPPFLRRPRFTFWNVPSWVVSCKTAAAAAAAAAQGVSHNWGRKCLCDWDWVFTLLVIRDFKFCVQRDYQIVWQSDVSAVRVIAKWGRWMVWKKKSNGLFYSC